MFYPTSKFINYNNNKEIKTFKKSIFTQLAITSPSHFVTRILLQSSDFSKNLTFLLLFRNRNKEWDVCHVRNEKPRLCSLFLWIFCVLSLKLQTNICSVSGNKSIASLSAISYSSTGDTETLKALRRHWMTSTLTEIHPDGRWRFRKRTA